MAGPMRPVRLGETGMIIERRDDGTIHARSPVPLNPYPGRLTDRLEHWARTAPERVFLAQRGESGGWRHVTYAGALATVRSIATALLGRGLRAERPVAILSDNGIEHALLGLAAMHAGIPYAPISAAYSLMSADFGKLRQIMATLTPGLVFAADGARYARAIAAAMPDDAELVLDQGEVPGRQATRLADLAATRATAAVDAAHAATGPDTIAKFLFTSGSTGMPKGVVNTQRMLCSNQEMIAQHLSFLKDEPPVMVDWLPWNHTFGGNHNCGIALYNGGTLYIDEGKPTPGGIEATVANLREVAPTVYFNVPRGFEALVPYLRREKRLREIFFSRVKLMFYAGAGLSQHVWDEMERLALDTVGERIAMITGLGSTETAPSALFTVLSASQSGAVGVPLPGVELKLAPVGDKLEGRVRGPNITPGYWRDAQTTRAAFDDEGFYRYGDALTFLDDADPMKGFAFDGRISENFKLSSGTWVTVGALRSAFLPAFSPYAKDVVIAGHDRDCVTALVFPDIDACRALCPELGDAAKPADLLRHDAVRATFAALLAGLAAKAKGSASRIERLVLLDEPPSIDANEITDKGSINQRAVLTRRAALVDALYAEPWAEVVIGRGPISPLAGEVDPSRRRRIG